VIVLLVSLGMNSVGLRWGLPNGNNTWAADAIQPLTPMSVAKHALGSGFNSGWFYFKYPLGHPLLLLLVQAPYLAWLRVTGQLKTPTATYPHGFRDPERALSGLALLTRAVSVAMGVGLVLMAYLVGSLLFGPWAGVTAAVLLAGCYPFVYYAHTSNVDVPMVFWIALAFLATLRCADRGSLVAAAVAGAAAGMALLTKEQSLGALASLPLVFVLRARSLERLRRVPIIQVLAVAAGTMLAVTIVIGVVWWNPMGYVNRWRFLLGVLPPALRDQYAPYQFQVQMPTGFSWSAEGARVLKVAGILGHGLTMPVAILSVLGTGWVLWRKPAQALVLVVFLTCFYLLSLRATALVQIRYAMPLMFGVLLLAGAAGGAIIEGLVARGNGLGWVSAVALASALSLALLPGVEVDHLLLRDPRYAAEAWLRAHAPPQARVEIYERPTYLPRFDKALRVFQVAVEERSVGAFQLRLPDLVVLSTGGKAGHAGRYVRDWEPGKPIIADVSDAREFFARLRGGALGYQRVGHFQTPTRWVVPRINSLNPEISIFAAPDAAPSS
jgi:hypothetical protein